MKLSFIRVASAAAVLALAVSPAAADLAAATASYGRLLAQYVTPRGVKYEAWRTSGSDLKAISEVVMLYRSTDPKPLSPDERKALYINLYNAKVLETVLLGNPNGSIKELSRGLNSLEVFSRSAKSAAAEEIAAIEDLMSDLEKRLREEFKDPRVHFAVNCASKSCPPIRPEPYDAATLDARLEESTRKYLASLGADTSASWPKFLICSFRIAEISAARMSIRRPLSSQL